MSEETQEVQERKKPGPKPKPVEQVPCEFKNTSKVNLFTESGRCHPGHTIFLTDDQAAKYKGLEKC